MALPAFPPWHAVLLLAAISMLLAAGVGWIVRAIEGDRFRPVVAAVAVVVGILAGYVSLLLEVAIPTPAWRHAVFLEKAVEPAIVEELVKAGLAVVVLASLIRWGGASWDARRGALVGALVGAGFGVFEGFWFAASHWNQLGVVAGISQALMRTLAGGLHVLTTGAAVWAIARWFESRRGMAWTVFLVAVLYHAANNAVKVAVDEYGFTRGPLNLAVLAWGFLFYFIVAEGMTGRFDATPRQAWRAIRARLDKPASAASDD